MWIILTATHYHAGTFSLAKLIGLSGQILNEADSAEILRRQLNLIESFRIIQAFTGAIMVTGFFSFFFFSVRLSLPLIMLKVASKDIIGYMTLFLVGLGGFGSAALMIFGHYVPEFTNLNRSFFQMLLIMAGTFDADTIVQADSFFAPVFLFTFLVIFNLLLYRTFPILMELKVNEFSEHLDQASKRFFLFITRQIHVFVREVDISIEDRAAEEENRRNLAPELLRRKKTVKITEVPKQTMRERIRTWVQENYIRGKKYIRDTIWSDLYPILISHEQSYRLLHAADTHKKFLKKMSVDPNSRKASNYIYQKGRFSDLDCLGVQPTAASDPERFQKLLCFKSLMEGSIKTDHDEDDSALQVKAQSSWMVAFNDYIGMTSSGKNFFNNIKMKSVRTSSSLMFTADLAERAKDAAKRIPPGSSLAEIMLKEIDGILTQYTTQRTRSDPKLRGKSGQIRSPGHRSSKNLSMQSQISFSPVAEKQPNESGQSIEDNLPPDDEMLQREPRVRSKYEVGQSAVRGSAILDQPFPNEIGNRFSFRNLSMKSENSWAFHSSLNHIHKFTDVIKLLNESFEAVFYVCIFDEYYQKKIVAAQYAKAKNSQKKKNSIVALLQATKKPKQLTEEEIMIPIADGLKVLETSSNLTMLQVLYHRMPKKAKIDYWLKSEPNFLSQDRSAVAEMPVTLRYALLLSMGYTFYSKTTGLLVFSELPELVIYLAMRIRNPSYDLNQDKHLFVREELNPSDSPFSALWLIPPHKDTSKNKLRMFWVSRKPNQAAGVFLPNDRSPKSPRSARSANSAKSGASGAASPRGFLDLTGDRARIDFGNEQLLQRYDLVGQVLRDKVLSKEFFHRLYSARTVQERFEIAKGEESIKNSEFMIMWFSLCTDTQIRIILNTRNQLSDLWLEVLVSQIVWGDFSSNVELMGNLNDVIENDLQNLILVTTRNKAITASMESKKGSIDQLSQANLQGYCEFLRQMGANHTQITEKSGHRLSALLRTGQFRPEAFLDSLRVSNTSQGAQKQVSNNDSKSGHSFSQTVNETFQNNIARRDFERIEFFHTTMKRLKVQPVNREFDAASVVRRKERRASPITISSKRARALHTPQSAATVIGQKEVYTDGDNADEDDRVLGEHVQYFEITPEQERFLRRERRMNEFTGTPEGEVLREAYQFMLEALRNKRLNLVSNADPFEPRDHLKRPDNLAKYLKVENDPIPEVEFDDVSQRGDLRKSPAHSIIKLQTPTQTRFDGSSGEPAARPLVQTSDEDAGVVQPEVSDKTQTPWEVQNQRMTVNEWSGTQYPPSEARYAFHSRSPGQSNGYQN